ncbi:30S ribosomal protein S15, partial [Dysosmobacter welbionis]
RPFYLRHRISGPVQGRHTPGAGTGLFLRPSGGPAGTGTLDPAKRQDRELAPVPFAGADGAGLPAGAGPSGRLAAEMGRGPAPAQSGEPG